MRLNPRRVIARTLALLWGAFWVYFVVASTLSEPGSPIQKLFICLVGSSLFLGSALAPWLSEKWGGVALLLEGIFLCITNYTYLHNPPATQTFLLLTLALPPLLSGILFLTLQARPHSQPG